MAANIEWAQPEITECWAYSGRLYRSLKNAQREHDHAVEWRRKWREKHGEKGGYGQTPVPPIYHVALTWGEV